MSKTQVFITGAGPTGLVLALWLNRLGITVRIIDKLDSHVTQSRAMVVHARTLELYQQIGLADELVKLGNRDTHVNLHVNGKRKARFIFDAIGDTLTPYPWLLIFPQDSHEALLERYLQSVGINIERNTELIDFTQNREGIVASIRNADGSINKIEAQFLAGCDGAHSRVREILQVSFEGGTYDKLYYVADVEATGKAADKEAHIALERTDFLVVLPYGQQNKMRLIGTFKPDKYTKRGEYAFDDINSRCVKNLSLKVSTVNWFSEYRVHHRVAKNFQHNNVFLLGDAAHVHSPVGGQGMNTGIGDAVNLAWKLAAVVKNEASESLLKTYQTERQKFAYKLVKTTDKAFSIISGKTLLSTGLRSLFFPFIASTAYHIPALQKRLFSVLSQISLNYRHSTLSEGKAGNVFGGDRLPWVKNEMINNFASLQSLKWQVHIYGEFSDNVAEWCHQVGVVVEHFNWHETYAQFGLAQNALYLIRPDGYVALASSNNHLANLQSWYVKSKITFKRSGA